VVPPHTQYQLTPSRERQRASGRSTHLIPLTNRHRKGKAHRNGESLRKGKAHREGDAHGRAMHTGRQRTREGEAQREGEVPPEPQTLQPSALSLPPPPRFNRESSTAELSCRRFAALEVMGDACTAGSRPQPHPAAAPAAEHQASFILHPSSFILRSSSLAPPHRCSSVVPNPKPSSRTQVCGSDGTSPSQSSPYHKTHLHFVCFVSFVVQKTPPSIRVHPWFEIHSHHHKCNHRITDGTCFVPFVFFVDQSNPGQACP
jgi:hypothetical protein